MNLIGMIVNGLFALLAVNVFIGGLGLLFLKVRHDLRRRRNVL